METHSHVTKDMTFGRDFAKWLYYFPGKISSSNKNSSDFEELQWKKLKSYTLQIIRSALRDFQEDLRIFNQLVNNNNNIERISRSEYTSLIKNIVSQAEKISDRAKEIIRSYINIFILENYQCSEEMSTDQCRLHWYNLSIPVFEEWRRIEIKKMTTSPYIRHGFDTYYDHKAKMDEIMGQIQHPMSPDRYMNYLLPDILNGKSKDVVIRLARYGEEIARHYEEIACEGSQ